MWNSTKLYPGVALGLKGKNADSWCEVVTMSWLPMDTTRKIMREMREVSEKATFFAQQSPEYQEQHGEEQMALAMQQIEYILPLVVHDWEFWDENEDGEEVAIPTPKVLKRTSSLGTLHRIPTHVTSWIIEQVMEGGETEIPLKSEAPWSPSSTAQEMPTEPPIESKASLESPEATPEMQSEPLSFSEKSTQSVPV